MTRNYISNIFKAAALSLSAASLSLSLLLASCSQEVFTPDEPVSSVQLTEGEPFLISGSLDIPEMLETQTRAAGGETPASGLKLTILEFSLGSNATNSFLTNIYRATIKTTTNTLDPVTFTAELTATSEPRILHFMLTKDDVTCEYGSEATLLPSISSSYEAYWYRLKFPNGYMNTDGSGTLADDVVAAMTGIPMIRNFAKLTLSNSDTNNFELYGYQLVNIPSAATIAPFNVAATQVPTLLNDSKQMLKYSQVMAQNTGYHGIMPANVTFTNTETNVKAMNNFQHTNKTDGVLWGYSLPTYFFEHPFNRLNYSYLIVQGRYHGKGIANASDRIDYYKIDLGNTNSETGLFEYYDLLRNYNFKVVINNVRAPGAATPAEAIELPPSNNISASVETSSMRNVSDGKNMLFVNETNYIFTTTEPVYFRYHYVQDITGTHTAANDVVKIDGLKAGDVIKSVGEPETYTDEQGTVWVQYEITPNTPSSVTKEQSFTVFDGLGLGREINLTLHDPWYYRTSPAASVWEGSFDQPTQASSGSGGVTYRQGIVSSEAGAEFTVYFYLPDGLSETMFPLQFQLEANPQNMENNPIGTLVVNTGTSLFDDDVTAISYVKTVSYKEYVFMYKGDGSNDVGTISNSNHIVRCRFRTINSGTGTTTIRIYNPYFKTATSDYEIVTFTRQ